MPMNYDNRQQTRVYRREQPDAAETRAYDERIGFTQPLTKPKGVFDGISIAQVVAGAAAAATSMLLASKIGIAGSVIGAAVSSAVTVICSQLYRRALEKSAEKLKLDQLGLGASATPAYGDARAGYNAGNPYSSTAPSTESSGHGTRIAPATLRMRAAEERRGTQRKVLAVSAVLAVAAVALTAGIILLGTAGQGLGERPDPIIPVPSQQQNRNAPAGTSAASNDDSHTGNHQQTPDTDSDNSANSNSTGQQPDGTTRDPEHPDAPGGETGTDTENPDKSDSDPNPETGTDADTNGNGNAGADTGTTAPASH